MHQNRLKNYIKKTYHALSEMRKREFTNDLILHQNVLGKFFSFDQNLFNDVLDFPIEVDLLCRSNVNLKKSSER